MPRTWVLVALLASAVGCALVAVLSLVVPAPRPAVPVVEVAAASPVRAAPLAVLRDWDAARADAWGDGDTAALRALYAGSSRSGLADRRLLAAYAARGLWVRDLVVQRASVEVVRREGDRLVLQVTDRLAGGWVRTASGARVDLPRDRWSTRTMVLTDGPGGWLVVEVRDRGGRGPTRPPR